MIDLGDAAEYDLQKQLFWGKTTYMKLTIRIGFCLVVATVLSQTVGLVFANEEGFEKRKQAMMKEMDDRIGNLQTTKTCISSAKDRMAMNGCYKNMRESRMKERSEMLERRKEHIEERMQKLQNERSKIESNP